ncbi:CinA family protein [Pseudomonas sp. RIT-PI-AD]|uniref:CinA family protein n=1 Tax=Pseudomonas sp. RIT-PI-AD TaxID=3035294 RepID=UPI0021DA52E7|nr:CinA family protein [Pseudomonas sp. RIT-PI-AD]
MNAIQRVMDYLQHHELVLTTAESCTAGSIVSLLATIPGCGACLDAGYVVYSPEAKKRLLGVRQETLDRFNLTSQEVAWEMAVGALHDSDANLVIANTGIAGPEGQDGIPPGTLWFAWGFRNGERLHVFTRKERFPGDRCSVLDQAARYALDMIPAYHQRFLRGEG